MRITWSQVTTQLTGKLDLNDLNRLPTHYTYVNLKSIKILPYNMPSIHEMYEYGNIAIEESFDIIISDKAHIKRKQAIRTDLTTVQLKMFKKQGNCIQF